MENKVLIREAGAGELEAVEALVKGAYREYRELVPEEGWERWMASITLAINEGAGQLLVAEAAGAIQGVVQFFPDARLFRPGALAARLRDHPAPGGAPGVPGFGAGHPVDPGVPAPGPGPEAAHHLFIHRPLHAGGPAYL